MRASKRPRWLAVALVLVVAACGSGGPRDRVRDDTVTYTVGPRKEVHGVPRGWSRNEAGARGAAIAYVSLTGDFMRAGLIGRHDLVAAMTTPDFVEEFSSRTYDQLQPALEALEDEDIPISDVVWSEMPLTAQVMDADADQAQVEVWSVVVTGVPDGMSPPLQGWRTVTLDLEWVDDDWLISGWDVALGPTPSLMPDAHIDGLDAVRRATSAPSAAAPEEP